jgi:hypothetical protein
MSLIVTKHTRLVDHVLREFVYYDIPADVASWDENIDQLSREFGRDALSLHVMLMGVFPEIYGP